MISDFLKLKMSDVHHINSSTLKAPKLPKCEFTFKVGKWPLWVRKGMYNETVEKDF